MPEIFLYHRPRDETEKAQARIRASGDTHKAKNRAAYGISARRACSVSGLHKCRQRYRKRSDPQTELRMRLKDLAAARARYGYRRLHILLRREG